LVLKTDQPINQTTLLNPLGSFTFLSTAIRWDKLATVAGNILLKHTKI
jgi:hypothetical protein